MFTVVISTITFCNNHKQPHLMPQNRGSFFRGHYWLMGGDDIYSVWRICHSSRVCVYSFISYTEYAMSCADFLLPCLLWSIPTVLPFWTIPPATFTENVVLCGQWNAQAEMRIDLKMWIGETNNSGHDRRPLRGLNKLEKWLDFDNGNDTYLPSLLSSGQNNDIIFQGQRVPVTLWRAAGFGLRARWTWGKKILNSQIGFWSTSTLHSSNLYCQANIIPARQKKGSTCLWAGVGAKYFNNSSLTARKRAREREVQRSLVLDAVGAAVRGDRLVPVLHEEVSENISHRDEQQHQER